MSILVHTPTPFLPCVGEPAVLFSAWKKIFANCLLVINATDYTWPDARLRATLLHCLGMEGQGIFYTLPDGGTTYAAAWKITLYRKLMCWLADMHFVNVHSGQRNQ